MASLDTEVAKTPYGFYLVPLDVVTSTNDEAQRLARAGMPDKTCVWARRQQAGRGRHGRTWYSPQGNLYCSILIRPEGLVIRHTAQLSFIAAVSVGEAICPFLRPTDTYCIKWPNDILINDAKVAGILLETENLHRISCTIVGIGVNIFAAPKIVTAAPATALAWCTDQHVTVEQLLLGLLHRFAYWYDIWIKEGFSPVRTEWIKHALGWGQRLIVQRDPTTTVQGWFRTIGEDGSLGLRSLDDQTMHWIRTGDVMFPSLQEAE